VPSTSAGKLVVDRPFEKRGALFVWSAVPLSPRVLPSPKAFISGSIAKHLLTRFPTWAFFEGTKFNDANAQVMLACAFSLRDGRGEALGGRDGGDFSARGHCAIGVTVLATNNQCSICDGSYLGQKVWTPYNIKIVPY
jgi:hypothetical protein